MKPTDAAAMEFPEEAFDFIYLRSAFASVFLTRTSIRHECTRIRHSFTRNVVGWM